jgi:hypothetical protein
MVIQFELILMIHKIERRISKWLNLGLHKSQEYIYEGLLILMRQFQAIWIPLSLD